MVDEWEGLRLTWGVFLDPSPPYLLNRALLLNPNLTSLATWVASEMLSLPPMLGLQMIHQTHPGCAWVLGSEFWSLCLHSKQFACRTLSPAPSCPSSEVVLLSYGLITLLPDMKDEMVSGQSQPSMCMHMQFWGFPKPLCHG